MTLATLKALRKINRVLQFRCFTGFADIPNLSPKIRVSTSMDSFSRFGLYKNKEEILDYLSEHDNVPEVHRLIEIYNKAKTRCTEQHETPKHPLIVLEGLDGSGKTSMTKKLSKKAGAERWLTPPESIRHLRDYFDGDAPTLRTAYYSLGNYIAALEVECILPKQPVILDRFWHSTTAYAIAQKIANSSGQLKLPEPSDEIYKWPADLLKPDRVILLDVSEEARLERQSRRRTVTVQEQLLNDEKKFREDVVRAFKNMREPVVTVINGEGSFMATVHKLFNDVKPLLNN